MLSDPAPRPQRSYDPTIAPYREDGAAAPATPCAKVLGAARDAAVAPSHAWPAPRRVTGGPSGNP